MAPVNANVLLEQCGPVVALDVGGGGVGVVHPAMPFITKHFRLDVQLETCSLAVQ